MQEQYKLLQNADNTVLRLSDNAFIPFDPANTDYQTFKANISADEAQLENTDDTMMTADEAKEFVGTLQ